MWRLNWGHWKREEYTGEVIGVLALRDTDPGSIPSITYSPEQEQE